MVINIKIEKKDLWLVSAIFVFLIGVGYVVAEWDTTKAMYHNSEDVQVAISGNDYSLQEAIDSGILSKEVKSDMCYNECYTDASDNYAECKKGYYAIGAIKGSLCSAGLGGVKCCKFYNDPYLVSIATDISGTTTSCGSGQAKATATVTVKDANDNYVLLTGATVTGKWSGEASGTVSGVTDANGVATFNYNCVACNSVHHAIGADEREYIIFTVTKIEKNSNGYTLIGDGYGSYKCP
jgi:hypothetical protein